MAVRFSEDALKSESARNGDTKAQLKGNKSNSSFIGEFLCDYKVKFEQILALDRLLVYSHETCLLRSACFEVV